MRTLAEHFDPSHRPKRLLSLDGGGVRGVFSLGILQTLEAELRRRSGNPNLMLSDFYDVIGGTSTGSIIASALALGMSTAELTELYMSLGSSVFGKQSGDGGLFRARFDHKNLEAILREVLGKRTLGSADLKTGLLICAARLDTGSNWVVTNNPSNRFYDAPDTSYGVIPNKRYLIADLVRASAAAPTYFEEVRLPVGSFERDGQGQIGYFIDGALSGNNDPSLRMLLHAIVPGYGFEFAPGARALMLTSVGTGFRRPTVDTRSLGGMLSGMKALRALRAMIHYSEVTSMEVVQALAESMRPWYVNSEIGGQSRSKIEPLLHYQRINTQLDRKPRRARGVASVVTSVEQMLGLELSPKELEQMGDLSNGHPRNMELLLALGQAVGRLFIGPSYPEPAFDEPDW